MDNSFWFINKMDLQVFLKKIQSKNSSYHNWYNDTISIISIMILKLKNLNYSKIGYVLGIIYCIYFNNQNQDYNDYIISFAFSIPFLIISFLIGFGISKIRKDKLSGVYFLITNLILVTLT